MRFILILSALVSAAPAAACDSDIDLERPLEARRVLGGPRDRATFHSSPDASAGVPASRSAFVIGGDIVLVSQTQNGFACAHYVSRSGTQTNGWIQLSSLLPARPAGGDWAGRWSSGPEQTITIRRSRDGLSLDGTATYGALDPVRVRNGAVNEGTIAATLAPRGADAAFTVSTADGATLPFEAGQPSDCRLRLARRGPYLVAWDNLACGGHNVTFRGIYRRR